MDDIGEHCGYPECHQLDFLPFFCGGCNTFYCLEHRSQTAHCCCKSSAADDSAQPPATVACKRCRRLLVVPDNLDSEAFLSLHRQSASCAEAARRLPLCALQSCRAQTMKSCLVECPDCSQLFCLRHRFSSDHECLRRTAVGAASPDRSRVSRILAEAGFVKGRREEDVSKGSKDDAGPEERVSGGAHCVSLHPGRQLWRKRIMTSRALSTMRKIEAIKMKMKVKPDLSIPEADRILVRVDMTMAPEEMLPVNLSSAKDKDGAIMYVDGSKTAGWNLDKICKKLSIRNANAETGDGATFWALGMYEAEDHKNPSEQAVGVTKIDPGVLLKEMTQDGSVLFLLWDDLSV
ncbi:Protein F58E10.4, confirmed by transcript evidence, related [Neospora caninum Liverpool]|uniref:Protein F58E10.4, confirmed by transcript evidence, related n=1 Tax=Neospora caninum (strain Liverpool) TaxID=572307 RepID=F0VJH5_NEOCL|nr:Protein F58E10.4, confirmed by transcript evidence, related [Neospora caninum Liverpool]CBZ53886.1 Protein F58E10.4, confirmed by transcript evidence, related [Neospora caninum Liverpool]CEL67881.1 TPA: Protein F58E10.4, confirmed by transcript evidence, related [Neospora caninum Liverpool]|eukprot:XP_003883918.1 Protein F58E10.4, confirmed by transcript evidence, related [Neospora caninum Liverpool]